MKINQFLEGKKTVGISGHVRPDGDCIGSVLALYNYICENYPEIEAKVFLEPIPTTFYFLKGSGDICSDSSEERTFDLFIASDCGDLQRLGAFGRYYTAAKETLCIDHHISNVPFADHNYVFPDASSASELVFDLLPQEQISTSVAECLYTGIVHDTGVFMYSCTSPKTMETAGVLMGKGIDYPKIVDETFYIKSFKQNQILGQALINAELHLDGQVIVSVLTQEEMQRYDVQPKHLNGIVNQLRITRGVKVALFLYANGDGTFKGSLRVNGDVDVARVAAAFGGGGHVKAAGLTIDGPAEEAVKRILDEIGKQL